MLHNSTIAVLAKQHTLSLKSYEHEGGISRLPADGVLNKPLVVYIQTILEANSLLHSRWKPVPRHVFSCMLKQGKATI